MAGVSRKKRTLSPSPVGGGGIFSGMVVFLVADGVQPRRFQIWKQRLLQMGAVISDQPSKNVTHILAAKLSSVNQVHDEFMKQFKGKLLDYQWLEDCLTLGEIVNDNPYTLNWKQDRADRAHENLAKLCHENAGTTYSDSSSLVKGTKLEGHDIFKKLRTEPNEKLGKENRSGDSVDICDSGASERKDDRTELSSSYNPPDLNRNVTGIFEKLIGIYRALGEERRSFSYQKAIPVIEKLPFKIENVDQVKHLPSIGKSLQDHINEIVTTGKLSKLEHFENDVKVRTVTLFGDVWGIGPATALKLYEKGHRALDDLRKDYSLTNTQRIGVEFFDDIKKRIPREEVKDMEILLQEVGKEILPGIMIVCGGSYRRGKATCGDIDIIITHPDGESHKGFLPKFVQCLKDKNFLREDLVVSIHSTKGTDSGIDTYFGLCAYPGRNQRHRIDFKVYPRSIYAFGLLAWTGNDVLNRRLRLLADTKGYRLDDTGLFVASPSSSGKRGFKSSASISCNTEREVFDVLGFPWLEPHERNL